MASRSLPPRQMWAAAAPPSSGVLHGQGGPTAASAFNARILDNGSSPVVNEASSKGGSGVYARPMQGVDQDVINDLSTTLNAMYVARSGTSSRWAATRSGVVRPQRSCRTTP